MKILYINHYAGSPDHGMEYRPYYLAREWVKMGHQVKIVASDYSHLRYKNPDLVDKPYLMEQIEGINYFWCKTSEYLGNGLKRLVNIISFLKQVWQLRAQILKDFTPDIIIASSTYPYDTLLANKLAKHCAAKFIYEVHDLWPLSLKEINGMNVWHPMIFTMQWAENYGYKNADKVVSLLPKALDYMQEHGLNPNKFVYIPNGVSIEDSKHTTKLNNEHHILLSRLKEVEGRFIILYAGGMGEANALDYLLSAFKLVMDKPLALVLVGEGLLKAKLQKRIKQEGIINIYLLASIPKTQIPQLLNMADALYLGWHKLPIYRFGVCPNKLFDYMLAAKPIIHSISAGNDLVLEADCGISVPAEDIYKISHAILSLSQLKAEVLMKMGYNAKQFVLKNHDYRILATRFLDKVSI